MLTTLCAILYQSSCGHLVQKMPFNNEKLWQTSRHFEISFSPFCFSCSLSPSISVCSELFFTSLVDTKKKTLTNVEAVKTPCVTIWLKTLSTPLPIVNNVLGSCLSFSDPSSHPMCPFFRFSFNLWQAKLTGRNTWWSSSPWSVSTKRALACIYTESKIC